MKIPVQSEHYSYDITLARGALRLASECFDLDRKVLIVTDTGVPKAYALAVAAQCREAHIVTIEQGEASKNFENYQKLLKVMLEASFTRHGCVVAVGGGVIGDLSGFAAASFMRGIDFYNIPTTLLSQVDSSIGGKVAIDFEGVKNIVGAFYQPKGVLIDPDLLKTLDKRQVSAGLAEAIKMAATSDAELFALFETAGKPDDILEIIIERSLLVKRAVVQSDPEEKGLRKVLNFGHTLGHAIESCHMGKLLHGECVALGMLPMCSDEVRVRLEKVLKKCKLPTKVKSDKEKLMDYAMHDKKAENGGISIVFVDEIGHFEFKKASREELSAYLEKLI